MDLPFIVIAPIAYDDTLSAYNCYFLLSTRDHKWVKILFSADLLKETGIGAVMGIELGFVLEEDFFYWLLFLVVGLIDCIVGREGV